MSDSSTTPRPAHIRRGVPAGTPAEVTEAVTGPETAADAPSSDVIGDETAASAVVSVSDPAVEPRQPSRFRRVLSYQPAILNPVKKVRVPKPPKVVKVPSGLLPAQDAPTQKLTLAAVLVGALILGGTAGVLKTPATVTAVTGPGAVIISNVDEITDLTATVARSTPSVVTVSATGSVGTAGGTGVVISEDGLILTNAHVVAQAGTTDGVTYRVRDSEGRFFDAKLVGVDSLTDLAVLKTNTTGTTPIVFANSNEANVGDDVIAIGSPLGYTNTVTTGIVSALHRSITTTSSLKDEPTGSGVAVIPVLQTDTAVNHGNSGGPLLNRDGELIGINVAYATPDGAVRSVDLGNIGIAFSIPSNVALRVSQEIIANGFATHGVFGAMVADADTTKGDVVAGATVLETVPGGSADRYGLLPGDVITSINGAPVYGSADITSQVRASAAGSTHTITFNRDGVALKVTVTVDKLG
jgi:putative serine protease PepD